MNPKLLIALAAATLSVPTYGSACEVIPPVRSYRDIAPPPPRTARRKSSKLERRLARAERRRRRRGR